LPGVSAEVPLTSSEKVTVIVPGIPALAEQPVTVGGVGVPQFNVKVVSSGVGDVQPDALSATVVLPLAGAVDE
jgi:hypothetical protein